MFIHFQHQNDLLIDILCSYIRNYFSFSCFPTMARWFQNLFKLGMSPLSLSVSRYQEQLDKRVLFFPNSLENVVSGRYYSLPTRCLRNGVFTCLKGRHPAISLESQVEYRRYDYYLCKIFGGMTLDDQRGSLTLFISFLRV